MKDEEFRQKLSEVAEWEVPKLPPSVIAESKRRSRGRKSKEDLYQEEHEEIFLDLFDGVNPTYAPVLLKLKNKAVNCEDCGKHCENGRHKETKRYESGPQKKVSWRERCVTCEKCKNPFTGEFDLTIAEASHVWLDFLRDRKGEYLGKHARRIQELNEKKQAGIIRINPESSSMK